jgi:GWxTD domain-containing protein
MFPFVVIAEGQYDLWLKNEGYYLLNPKEKEKFKALPDAEKEAFIQNVWDSRDPSPITPENEFQIEYMKRFEYVKRHYGIPSDRAKIYLLLGAPQSVETHPNSDKYYPLELWSYYSLGFRELPPSLELIFFKRWGSGDYRLYSPLFDGFKALTPSQVDTENPRQRAQLLSQFDPQIVQAAQNISTGVGPNASETVRMVLTDPYAYERIENKRPSVETTVVYQSFEADIFTYPYPSKDGMFRTGVALAIPPKYLTFEKNDEKYNGRVDFQGKILDQQGHELSRINDSPAVSISPEEFEKAKAYTLSYVFDTYLLPGKYTFSCIYRDYGSNSAGKLEKDFEIKALTGKLELLTPLFAYKSVAAEDERFPFSYNHNMYYPKENSSFNNGQTLFFYTEILNPEAIDLNGTWKMQVSLKKPTGSVLDVNEDLPVSSGTKNVNIVRKMKLQSLTPGSYVFSITLQKDSQTLVAEAPIRITTDEQILGRMRITPKPDFSPEFYHTNVALQYLYRGNYTEASKHSRIALDFAPSSYAARSLNARIEKAKGNLDGALTTYEKLLVETPTDSEGFYLVGTWAIEKQDYKKASDMLKKAMSLGYYTTDLLNQLARAEIQLGNSKDAVNYWEKSLALNANQPEIQKLLATHKKS